MSENWKPIPGYETLYEASDAGAIRSIRSGAILKGSQQRHGYRYYWLPMEGRKAKRFLGHRLVAAAWHGPCPEGHYVDHINGQRDDNRPANLRYVTPLGNVRATMERDAHAYGDRNGQAKLSNEQVAYIRKLASESRFWGAKRIANELGIAISTVRRAARGQSYVRITDREAEPRYTVEQLRRAVLAERERCARIAESDEFYGSAVQHGIASAIRREAEGK